MSRQGLFTTTVEAIEVQDARVLTSWLYNRAQRAIISEPETEDEIPAIIDGEPLQIKPGDWLVYSDLGGFALYSPAKFWMDFQPIKPTQTTYRTGGPIGTKEWAEYSDQIASCETVGDVLQAMITFYEEGITLEDKDQWGELVEQIVQPAYEKICELDQVRVVYEETLVAPAQLVDAIGHMNRDQLLGALTAAKMLIGAHQLDQTGLLDLILTRLIHQDHDDGDSQHPAGDNYARTELADPHPVGFTIDPISTSL